MNLSAQAQAQTQSASLSSSRSTRIPALAAVVFGCALVYVVGFAQSPSLHNAAHDTRHTLAFPCH